QGDRMKKKTLLMILSWLPASGLFPLGLPAQTQRAAVPSPACLQPALPVQPSQPARGPATPSPRDVTVAGIPGIVAGGAKWTKVWQAGGNSADGIIADKDGSALVAQEDYDAVLRIDKSDKASVYVSNAKGVVV